MLRRHLLRFAAIAALALGGLVGATRIADACSCKDPGPVSKAVKAAKVAFTGTIKSVRTQPEDGHTHYWYTLEVDGVYRGSVPASVELDTGTARGDCTRGELGAVGERWLIVASSATQPIQVFGCSVTRVITPAVTKQLKLVGKPKKPS